MVALNAIVTSAIVLLTATLIYGPWQSVCTAYARQILFEKRDAIFDIAMEGRLSFESRDYRTIRAMLEKSIRFAHELTLPSFFFYWFMLIWRGHKFKKSALLEAIDRIRDDRTREEVRSLVKEAFDTLILMMIFKSPVAMLSLTILAIPLVAASFFKNAWAGARRLRDQSQELIQAEAENIGPELDQALPA